MFAPGAFFVVRSLRREVEAEVGQALRGLVGQDDVGACEEFVFDRVVDQVDVGVEAGVAAVAHLRDRRGRRSARACGRRRSRFLRPGLPGERDGAFASAPGAKTASGETTAVGKHRDDDDDRPRNAGAPRAFQTCTAPLLCGPHRDLLGPAPRSPESAVARPYTKRSDIDWTRERLSSDEPTGVDRRAAPGARAYTLGRPD